MLSRFMAFIKSLVKYESKEEKRRKVRFNQLIDELRKQEKEKFNDRINEIKKQEKTYEFI